MSLMERSNASRQPQFTVVMPARQNKKRKQQNPPRNPPAQKRQKNNAGNSVARPQRAAAAAYATGQHTGEAKIFRSGKDSCRIVHRELIGSISGTAGFTVAQAVALNPGLSTSFPWLSTQAQAWERYRFNKLRFCFYTRTGSNTPGSMLLAPDYDAADPAPIAEGIASSYEDCEEDAPWKDITCVLPQRSLMGDMKEKTIRSGALQPNQDIKTYDAGNLFACTVDGTAVGWGKLWVEYDVTLFQPQVPSGGFQATGALRATQGLSAASPFGAASVSTGNIVLTPSSTGVVTIQGAQLGQEIYVSLNLGGTTVTAGSMTPTGLTTKSLLTGIVTATDLALNSTYIVTSASPTIAVAVSAATVTDATMVVTVLSPIPSF